MRVLATVGTLALELWARPEPGLATALQAALAAPMADLGLAAEAVDQTVAPAALAQAPLIGLMVAQARVKAVWAVAVALDG